MAEEGWSYAATAAIFRDGPEGAELLFIRRSAHNGDPWAGQIAFPGGRHDPTDDDLEHTARRETWEEVGLDLASAGVEPLGALDELRARSRKGIHTMAIRPHAYLLPSASSPPPLTPNNEVASAFWTPMTHLTDPARQVRYDAARDGAPRTFDAIDLGPGQPLWGLTHRMVLDILGRLALVCALMTAGCSVQPPRSGEASAEGEGEAAEGRDGEDGRDGVDGAQGPAGPEGAAGPEGPAGADGAQGPAGADGRDGVDGRDGEDCFAGLDDQDGDGDVDSWDCVWFAICPGPFAEVPDADGDGDVDLSDCRELLRGSSGRDGRDGRDGQDGQDGRDGQDGEDGRDGGGGAAPGDDFDGDGVDNAQDNCPFVDNPDQSDLDLDGDGDGCDPDDDGDRVADGDDSCPELFDPDQADLDDDGQGDACDPDDDGDGVLDHLDNCPRTINAGQEDLDGDDRGDACDDDRDGDLWPDVRDNCPDFANDDQSDIDHDGLGDLCDPCPQDPGEANGDTDEDGIADACDNCPLIPNRDQVDLDEDGEGDDCDDDRDGDLVANDEDCGPDDSSVFPGRGIDDCDGLDNDCDEEFDETHIESGCETGFEGVCALGTLLCVNGITLCDQNVQESDEECDGLDNDCDGAVDEDDGQGDCGPDCGSIGWQSLQQGGVTLCFSNQAGICRDAHAACESLGHGYRLLCGDHWQPGFTGEGCGGNGSYTSYDFVNQHFPGSRGFGAYSRDQRNCVSGGVNNSCDGDSGHGDDWNSNGSYGVCAPQNFFMEAQDGPEWANVCGR